MSRIRRSRPSALILLFASIILASTCIVSVSSVSSASVVESDEEQERPEDDLVLLGGIGGGDDEEPGGGIVGGTTVVDIDEFPFFARNTGSINCGAALIAPNVLISAGHCQPDLYPGRQMYIGITNSNPPNAREEIAIEEVMVHPNYDKFDNFRDDVMILKLKSSSSAPPVPLNLDDTLPNVGDNVTAMGFGRTAYQGAVSYTLQKVSIPVVSEDDCASAYGMAVANSTTKLCAGGDVLDSCLGDSGGPLVDEVRGNLVGIVSSGYKCAIPDYPGVYTRISGVQDFLREGLCEFRGEQDYELPFVCPGQPTLSPASTAAPSVFESPTAAPLSFPTEAPTVSPESSDGTDMPTKVVVITTKEGAYCPEEEDQCADDAGTAGEFLYLNFFGLFCWDLGCVTSWFFRVIVQFIWAGCGSCSENSRALLEYNL